MAAFLNVCRFNPTAGSTTDWTYSSIVTGYQSPTSAGVVNSRVYKYRAESTDLSQWEIGEGAYDTGTGVLARTTVLYNSSGTGTASGQSGAGSKINFSTVPNVAIVAIKEDLVHLDESNTFTSQNIFNVSTTVASGPSATLDDFKISAATATVTGTTQITAAEGFNKASIYRPTITAASAVTIDNAATLYIDNAPLAAGSATITAPWVLRTGAGQVNFNAANEQGEFVDAFGVARNSGVVINRNVTSSASTRNEGLLINEIYNNSTAAKSATALLTEMYIPAANSTNHDTVTTCMPQNVIDGTGTIATQAALTAATFLRSTGTVTNQIVANLTNVNSGGGTVTLAWGARIAQPVGATAALTSTWGNIYGIDLYNQNPSGAGTNTLTNPPKAIRIQSQTASGAYAISQEGSGIVSFASQIEALSGVIVTGATGEKLTIKGNANRFYLQADSNVPIEILNSAGTSSGFRVYTTDTQVALYSSGVARFNLTGSFIALTPNGTDTRFQISNTALQLHYDNIVLAPVANFPGITWKHVDALGGLDKPYGNIGVATSDSNKFRITSGPTAANIPANNSLILASYNGTSEIDRITIPGGAATVDIQVSNANLLSTGSVWAYSGTAIPAGGTTGSGFKLSSTANLGIFFGSGAPTLSAAKGSKYMRTDGSTTNNREYINTDGGTTWTAVITAA